MASIHGIVTAPTRMRFRHLLTLLGLSFVAVAAIERGLVLLLLWPGANFLALGWAHRRGWHRILGKRPDGTLQWWSGLLFLPVLAWYTVIWHLLRLFSRQPPYHVVTEQVVVGRRLLPAELDREFDNYVDLTAEFAEPLPLRRSPAYVSVAILDSGAPSPEALRMAVRALRPGTTFIHCAQGYGRSGLFALALLLASGAARSVDDGLRMLTAVRPRIRLNQEQQRCLRTYLDLLA